MKIMTAIEGACDILELRQQPLLGDHPEGSVVGSPGVIPGRGHAFPQNEFGGIRFSDPEGVGPGTVRTQPLPGETPSTGNDAVTVNVPGMAFPYPDYLRNIVQEVYRRWARPLGNAALRAEVSFLILRDGTVREIRLIRASGSFSFDLSAQGAIEAAGANRAFGTLPDGYPADVLPVSFYFTPRTQ